MKKPAVWIVCVCSIVFLTGCGGPVERWIVNTRVAQGDAAARRGSLHEAAAAYRLALKMDPRNPRGRAGFAIVSAQIAESDYRSGNYDDALATINAAQKYDPSSVQLLALRAEIDDARLKRQIVVSNYPTYRLAGTQIQAAYVALAEQDKLILHSLHRFAYTYDSQDLTRAIQDSYELQLDIAKNTNRLIAYRQLVESGAPVPAKAAQSAPGGSLLPLP